MKTFRMGGIHPNDHKHAKNAPIEIFPLPKKVVVMMGQHIGIPANPIVQKGDYVLTGQLIGKAEAFMCANIHSPVSGIVTKVDWCKDANGINRPAVYIDVKGDEWMPDIDRSTEIKRECDLQPKEIVEKIKEMGIVGLGGATFPTHIKYSIPEGKCAEYLIINGVECEPYLTTDYRAMMERTEQVMVGVSILRKALGDIPTMIGIEENKPRAIEFMSRTASTFEGIKVVPLKMKYPQGAEKQLIDALTGRRIGIRQLPIDVGCVVSNIATAFAVYEAVQKNKPLIERLMTITGHTLPAHHNYLVRIGISLNDILDYAYGGLPKGITKVISGGPMMGKAISNLNSPVVKGSASLLLIPKEEAHRGVETNCIRCGRCVKACPMGLEPYMFSLLLHSGQEKLAAEYHLLDCIECGSCQYSCPANKPLLDEIRLGKNKLRR